MSEIVDLDGVEVTPEVYAAWSEIARRLTVTLRLIGVPEEAIPEEQGRVEEDGSLVIFVEIDLPSGGTIEASLKVPPEHWAWRQPT